MKKKIAVIGAGFSGLSAATHLAHKGHQVVVFDNNSGPGGRAQKFQTQGFTFDMGPSWYWMPDVFEKHFKAFGKSVSDYYELIRLDPSYRIYYGPDDFLDVPASMEELYDLFESMEKGSSKKLNKFLSDARFKYEIGMNDLVQKPGLRMSEFASLKILKGFLRMNIFKSISKEIRAYFKNPKLVQWLEFPVLFLGARPQNTPALYSLMNYADLVLGTWYPKGGMYKIGEGMYNLAMEKGVEFRFNDAVQSIEVKDEKVSEIRTQKSNIEIDACIATADYHHVDKYLISNEYRQYSDKYWESRTMAPSALIYFLGVNKKVKGLKHHNLFFDQPFDTHAKEIYDDPQWPSKPLFYVCCPSKTDNTVAPEGQENIFVLIPVAPDLQDEEIIREHCFQRVLARMEKIIGNSFKEDIIFKRSFAHKDFIEVYNSFKGNAYGLANTLRQTAILKPSIKHRKIENLFFAGQLTVPGPGVPPCIISGKIAAQELMKRK